ncbi:unnamed protein product [Mycena citricolor]|uniref:Metallo-beta-lactamase domain-containing protein n=1 Tax=Mycena citricolor TaxID=2018698 RepID=A0AAD2GYD1_9AGAR|nr:unnamed protein product [Mycena citricolor]
MSAILSPSKHHQNTSGPFENPWPPVLTMFASAISLLRFPFERATPLEHDLHGVATIESRKPDWSILDQAEDRVGACWLGHAGFLVQLPTGSRLRPIRIVFDPIFSERAYPSAWVGPIRRLPAPCQVEDLPEVDFVAVSHNHYDHCDLEALKAIHNRFPAVAFLVPLGVKTTLVSEGGIADSQVHELDWWDELVFSDIAVRFHCTPAQHNSGRGVRDRNYSLWCGWAVSTLSEGAPSVYFAGDTGYQTADGPCPVFREIGERLGPFELAMVPIWSGATLTFLGKLGYRLSDDAHIATMHATPEDAVHLAQDVRAQHTLAMHFATFAGTDDEALEPLVRLARAQDGTADWRKENGVGAIHVGECVILN